MALPVQRISDDERASRQAAINFARGSVRLEGIILPPEMETINTAFINGEIDDDEHQRQSLALLNAA